MPTVTELIRRHLSERVGGYWPDPKPGLDELRDRRWVPEFERLMRDRLIMGAFRYECEDLREAPKRAFDNVPSMRVRLAKYEETGDLEHLVDVANLCMLEFRLGRARRDRFRYLGSGGDHGHHTEELK